MAQALTRLSVSEGFELHGLDYVGTEAAPATQPGSIIRSLHRLLDGYAYTLELAPADILGAGPGRPTRLTILGHSGHADDLANAPATADDLSDPFASADPAVSQITPRPVPGGPVQLLPEMAGMGAAASASLHALIQSVKQDCAANRRC